jgi:hypothetical protein
MYSKLLAVCRTFAEQQSRMIFQKIEDATEQSGNVVRHKGDPLAEDTILEALDRVMLDFEGSQVSPSFTFVMHPSLADRVAQFTPSEEFNRRHEQIINRQFFDWRFREADRKLVD